LTDSARPSVAARRFREARAALLAARPAGRYVRAGALDALIDLAAAGDTAMGTACLRAALVHLDAMGPRASPIEIDRVRTLRDRVAPALSVGPPLDPPRPPSELALRARAALEGLVRGPVPEPGHPDRAEAIALTALAHVRAGREAAAVPYIALLREAPTLPAATWGLIASAHRVRARRDVEPLALRAARELAPRFDVAGLAVGFSYPTARAIAEVALGRGEPLAAAVLRAVVEGEALRLRNEGRRPEAIGLLLELARTLERGAGRHRSP
jgi:hypothetical protein